MYEPKYRFKAIISKDSCQCVKCNKRYQFSYYGKSEMYTVSERFFYNRFSTERLLNARYVYFGTCKDGKECLVPLVLISIKLDVDSLVKETSF